MEIFDFLETQRNEYMKALRIMHNKINAQYETFVEPIEYRENNSYTNITGLNFYRYDVIAKTNEDSYSEITVNINLTSSLIS